MQIFFSALMLCNKRVLACFVFVLATSSGGCVNKSSINQGIELVYPYDHVDYGSIEYIHELAESVAAHYVKVSILQDSSADGRSGADQPMLVNGASGTILDGSGYVVTAAHIAKNVRYRAQITMIDGNIYDADIIYIDAGGELALLRILSPHRLPKSVLYQTEPQQGQ